MKIQSNFQANILPAQTEESKNKQQAKGFMDFLDEAIKKVSELENQANELAVKHLTGQGAELHDVVIAAQKAELSVQILNQIKNKVIRIYEELTRIQV